MSKKEDLFAAMLRGAGISFEREYRAIPSRRFRWDFAILPGRKVLVEIQGGIWKKGAHSSGVGLMRDYEKHNIATRRGFRVYYATDAEQMKWIIDNAL